MLMGVLSQEKISESLYMQTASARPVAKWMRNLNGSYYLEVSLPNYCDVFGTLSRKGSEVSMWIGYLNTNLALEGMGIGTRLMKNLVGEGVRRGVTTVGGNIVSAGALRIREKLFGRYNMEFHSCSAEGGKIVVGEKLDVGYNDALRSYSGQKSVNYAVFSRVGRTSVLGWEKPVYHMGISLPDRIF